MAVVNAKETAYEKEYTYGFIRSGNTACGGIYDFDSHWRLGIIGYIVVY